MAVKVHPADIQDRDGARLLLPEALKKTPTIRKLWVDAGYAGKCLRWMRREMKLDAEVVRRPDDRNGQWTQLSLLPKPQAKKGFILVKRRWVVERTFAWLGRYRRLSKDYEHLPHVAESVMWLCSLRMLIARLGRARPSHTAWATAA